MLDWGKKDEFVQAMFRRSHSVHSRRFYGVALREFGAFCKNAESTTSTIRASTTS